MWGEGKIKELEFKGYNNGWAFMLWDRLSTFLIVHVNE